MHLLTRAIDLCTCQSRSGTSEAVCADDGTAAVAAVAAGDMVAYSGYDMEVAVSSTLDNGMVAFRWHSTWALVPSLTVTTTVYWTHKAAAVALSAVTIKNGGVTYVVGQDKIDDLYDDTQNGDVSVSGAMGGISYTLVADLDKDTKAVAASTVTQLLRHIARCRYIRTNSSSSSRTRINIVETVWCSRWCNLVVHNN